MDWDGYYKFMMAIYTVVFATLGAGIGSLLSWWIVGYSWKWTLLGLLGGGLIFWGYILWMFFHPGSWL